MKQVLLQRQLSYWQIKIVQSEKPALADDLPIFDGTVSLQNLIMVVAIRSGILKPQEKVRAR